MLKVVIAAAIPIRKWYPAILLYSHALCNIKSETASKKSCYFL